MSTKIIDLRGAKVTAIHRGSVLLSKQEDLCSMATSGEPPTWFPLEKLVEQELLPR